MTAFTKIEQEVMDLAWYAVDSDGQIGHFTTGGFILLPSNISKSKETLQKVDNYFSTLPISQKEDYSVCPDLKSHIDMRLLITLQGYIKPSAEMSERGLYAYDNHPQSTERPYYRVTIPKNILRLNVVPEDIRNILKNFRMNAINFAKDTLISREVTDKI